MQKCKFYISYNCSNVETEGHSCALFRTLYFVVADPRGDKDIYCPPLMAHCDAVMYNINCTTQAIYAMFRWRYGSSLQAI